MDDAAPQLPFSTVCPDCLEKVEGASAIELERRWEDHKAAHRAAAAPADDSVAKRQAQQALSETLYKNEQDHIDDMARHYDAVSKVERRLPRLIDFGFKLANAVGQVCRQKEWRPKALREGNIYWVQGGEVAVEFEYDKHDISAPTEIEYLKRGYARLPQLHKEYPAVFNVVLTLGHHLANTIALQKLQPSDLSFTGLHHFVNPNTRLDTFGFKIINRRQLLKSSRAKF